MKNVYTLKEIKKHITDAENANWVDGRTSNATLAITKILYNILRKEKDVV